MTEPPKETEAQNGPPVGLDYFAAHEPDRRRTRAVWFWSVSLAAGWVPYLCGIVNALVVAQSYSPALTRSHNVGAVLFMGFGLVVSAIALAGFIRWRPWPGVIAAVALLGAQASIAGCLGVSSL